METWRDVIGWEGYYEVSNNGYVRSTPRPVDRAWGVINWSGKVLTPRIHSEGYLRVSLSREGVAVDAYIHRLVAEAFIHNPLELEYVNHKDGVKTNNCELNLEWVTALENNQHALDTGLREQIELIVVDKLDNVVYDGVTVSQLVKLGFQQPAISRCLSGKLKTHKGYKYEIKEKFQ